MSLNKSAGDEISEMIFIERTNTTPTVLDERNTTHYVSALNTSREKKFLVHFHVPSRRKDNKNIAKQFYLIVSKFKNIIEF